MHVTVITVDQDGTSHFADREIDLVARAYAPPAPPLEVSDPVPAARGMFFRMPPGWFGDWHPSPRHQYFVQTTGLLDVQVGDGEVRRLGPGTVVLLEDTHGPGHTTRVVGPDAVCGVFLHLPDE